MTEKIDPDAGEGSGRYGDDSRHDDAFEEALTQTAREERVGDAGDLANDLRLAEEQELIQEQSHGRFPTDEGGRYREEGAETIGLAGAAASLDVADEELAGTVEADASDDQYHAGDEQ
ncbi:hypothetical protein LVY72_20240 [Arthrobacter sp. I2-34]|uniref:DUF5709 domain-containing protein n=1 Tax=Arthrobacter hankyongi TaxID=2904801 RepID=A0ABS9LC94_9MICC|nr:hypothetical protein [Arthrobacter hankyongi]MCG2624223.1 hypothetical protein [Arthrobacter hankyongi]